MANPQEFVSGSMRSVSEVYMVQILLAYFLNKIDQLCTPDQLREIATGEEIVNYFDYVAAISAMLENGTLELVEIDGVEYYKLTERGASGAEDFKKQIPKNLRDKTYASGLRLFAKLKNERDIKFEITKQNEGFNVHCTCYDGELMLMDISLFASDEEQAKYIKSKIEKNPTDFYCKIMDYIIENEEYVPSISDSDDEEG